MKIIKNLRTLTLIEARTGLKFNTMFRNCVSPVSRRQKSLLTKLGYRLVYLNGYSYPFLARQPVA
jgi:hypothetical protein